MQVIPKIKKYTSCGKLWVITVRIVIPSVNEHRCQSRDFPQPCEVALTSG